MKNLKHIFSILAILIAVTLTSCNFNDNSEQKFTADSVGKWIIGDWNFNYSMAQKSTVNDKTLINLHESYSGTIKVKEIKDNSKVIISVEGIESEMNFDDFIDGLLGMTEINGTGIIESDTSSIISANKKKLTIKASLLSSSNLMGDKVTISLSHNFVMTKK
jgi:hypothetical protein